MAYQVLARKCRPQDFSSLIGQEPIVKALRNALADGRIAQAYLFGGIRGVGKTSAARVLAKALNCAKGPAADPCNDCEICHDITRGADMDVVEVDAATYSKVEQVRELTESLKYGPARDRYKVVILDEVHRLSRQAFDALLKIIEEPPDHLVFIFATTEMEAVPATILSRCQELQFRRVPVPVLSRHLASLCASEGIEASEASLRLIARAGEGSVRDSVALLDQLATFGGGSIPDDEALRLLGGLDAALYQNLLGAILDGEAAGVLECVGRIEEEGRDPRHAYAQFLTFCRDALHLALGGTPEGVDLPADEAAALAETAGRAGYENLLRLLHQLLASEASVRRSEVGALALEIAWLRAAELPKLVAVEELLRGGAPPPRPAPQSRQEIPPEPRRPTPRREEPRQEEPVKPSRPETNKAEGRPESERTARGPEKRGSQKPEPRKQPAPRETPQEPAPEPERPRKAPPARAVTSPEETIRALVEEVSQRKVPLAVHLQKADELEIRDGELIVHVREDDTLVAGALKKSSNRSVIEDALRQVLGEGARWSLQIRSSEARSPSAQPSGEGETPSRAAAEPSAAGVHPTEQTVLDLFDGAREHVVDRKGGSQ